MRYTEHYTYLGRPSFAYVDHVTGQWHFPQRWTLYWFQP